MPSLVAAEEGSFSAAGRVLRIAQPTIGRQIATLEEELGVALFERIGNAIKRTSAGLDLMAHLRAMGDAASRVTELAHAIRRLKPPRETDLVGVSPKDPTFEMTAATSPVRRCRGRIEARPSPTMVPVGLWGSSVMAPYSTTYREMENLAGGKHDRGRRSHARRSGCRQLRARVRAQIVERAGARRRPTCTRQAQGIRARAHVEGEASCEVGRARRLEGSCKLDLRTYDRHTGWIVRVNPHAASVREGQVDATNRRRTTAEAPERGPRPTSPFLVRWLRGEPGPHRFLRFLRRRLQRNCL